MLNCRVTYLNELDECLRYLSSGRRMMSARKIHKRTNCVVVRDPMIQKHLPQSLNNLLLFRILLVTEDVALRSLALHKWFRKILKSANCANGQ